MIILYIKFHNKVKKKIYLKLFHPLFFRCGFNTFFFFIKKHHSNTNPLKLESIRKAKFNF